jgi:hypothetical protein
MNHDSRSTSSGAKVLRGLPPVALFLLAAASTAMISDLVIRGERQPQVATNVANPDTIGEKSVVLLGALTGSVQSAVQQTLQLGQRGIVVILSARNCFTCEDLGRRTCADQVPFSKVATSRHGNDPFKQFTVACRGGGRSLAVEALDAARSGHAWRREGGGRGPARVRRPLRPRVPGPSSVPSTRRCVVIRSVSMPVRVKIGKRCLVRMPAMPGCPSLIRTPVHATITRRHGPIWVLWLYTVPWQLFTISARISTMTATPQDGLSQDTATWIPPRGGQSKQRALRGASPPARRLLLHRAFVSPLHPYPQT